MATKADLKSLERERARLEKARDAESLEALAERAAELPRSDRRDRLIYAARQNAAYARRGQPRNDRAIAIGVSVLTLAIVAGIVALAVFADSDTNAVDSYSLYNDRGETVQVWSCIDDMCSFRDEKGTVDPGEAIVEHFAASGDRFLIARADDGETLGCLTLPGDDTSDDPGVELVVRLSGARLCPAGAPTSVG